MNELDQAKGWAREWLLEAALPLWWQSGADREHGGFHDRLDQQARAVDGPKRLRVQARQAFVYAEAGKMGWDGPWRDAVMHGLDFMHTAYRRDDGLFRSAVTRDGTPHVETPDLYDQAFVLFGWASAYAALGRPAVLLERAEALLDTLETLWAHPERGFEEASPRRLPLRSNPHMHMLEALLAWVEAGGGARFERQARAIVGLALERLIDPVTGAVGEYYDGDWRFAPAPDGGLREPGHQFEWAFLLHRAARALGGDHREASARLYRFGESHGIHGGRAIFSTDAVGGVVDGSARLWAQTERLRTMLTFADTMPEGQAEAAALESLGVLRRYLDVPVKGLWRDRIDADGTLIDEPAPASSFYHIVTGFLPLLDPVGSVAVADRSLV